jgi:hypothetical protein
MCSQDPKKDPENDKEKASRNLIDFDDEEEDSSEEDDNDDDDDDSDGEI